jgi:hypothetical protein
MFEFRLGEATERSRSAHDSIIHFIAQPFTPQANAQATELNEQLRTLGNVGKYDEAFQLIQDVRTGLNCCPPPFVFDFSLSCLDLSGKRLVSKQMYIP